MKNTFSSPYCYVKWGNCWQLRPCVREEFKRSYSETFFFPFLGNIPLNRQCRVCVMLPRSLLNIASQLRSVRAERYRRRCEGECVLTGPNNWLIHCYVLTSGSVSSLRSTLVFYGLSFPHTRSFFFLYLVRLGLEITICAGLKLTVLTLFQLLSTENTGTRQYVRLPRPYSWTAALALSSSLL